MASGKERSFEGKLRGGDEARKDGNSKEGVPKAYEAARGDRK